MRNPCCNVHEPIIKTVIAFYTWDATNVLVGEDPQSGYATTGRPIVPERTELCSVACESSWEGRGHDEWGAPKPREWKTAMDADMLFLSHLAILVVVAIVLAVMKKRRPGWAWNTSPAWYATLTVACGLLPLQIYLLWDGDAPTISFIVLCVVADVGVWLLMYFVSKKRQLPRGNLPGRDISGGNDGA